MKLGNEKIIIDPNSGLPFIYAGAGKSEAKSTGHRGIFSGGKGRRPASFVFADGKRKHKMTALQFAQAFANRMPAAGSQANIAGAARRYSSANNRPGTLPSATRGARRSTRAQRLPPAMNAPRLCQSDSDRSCHGAARLQGISGC